MGTSEPLAPSGQTQPPIASCGARVGVRPDRRGRWQGARRQGRRRGALRAADGCPALVRRPCDAEAIADDPGDAPDLRAELDELYATPPDEFVAARNALVKQLRAARRRAEATEVAALRKPPRGVWTLNRLALSDDPHLADLLDAIEVVAAADGAGYRDAVAALRDRIAAAVDAAVAGIEAPKPDDHPDTMAALQAVLGDPDALALLVDGRLAEVPAGGLGALGLLPGAAAGGGATPRPPRRKPKLGVPPTAPEADDEAEDEPEPTGTDGDVEADVDVSLAERRRAKERERLERAMLDAVTAHAAARATAEAAAEERAAQADRLAELDEEVAATEAALAAVRAERDEQARTLADAEAAQHEADGAATRAGEDEAAARAALADHTP